eukprot:CAMPEP_0174338124 /NCGR_PEP_ID=MMETSP0810-20121108/22897_1 /TAXON_ID=73025 ORGANISM="Eutreptiella gymnastica-like, Strain CCMP1594" /NCGR_SAMPLE_ID=MMETSP0810 /ASSEMBLY_ACC=CAM_ASM_000659 /LENGTH=70 /DNA_ID=CAMNT_0015458045 /DNA_START=329 /DNA_END=540 /DNA_ORIENTATION=+
MAGQPSNAVVSALVTHPDPGRDQRTSRLAALACDVQERVVSQMLSGALPLHLIFGHFPIAPVLPQGVFRR